ncbi:phosphomevalonate kinase [Puccinia graminis f. sp. tritici]|uniref:Phosphomevalonate kinase n=1 Tax=Puccinia graminis f. sp. tritici TaxID=56615 RepID=A0A5B0Q174_PUCGR|nr:phosphomevalonate kinase [Puccinia graminis f. sp. tritici]
MFDSRETIVSCPGKVLIAGGYLVLDREYPGIVVGTSSRFYTVIRPAQTPPLGRSPEQQGSLKYQQIRLSIRSPQFIDAEWSYLISLSPQADLLIKPEASSSQNKFVELAVRESLKLSLALQSPDQFILQPPSEKPHQNGHSTNQPYPMTITILGDNDFYSQPRQDHAPVPAFNRLNTTLKDVHKTGLGSSAAMVTSLCSAILIHFAPSIKPLSRSTKLLLHNLSQYVHSLAQGKVGSGFDVSAAIYGTHVYRRFSPACLDGLLGSSGDQAHLTPNQIWKTLDPKINGSWVDASTAPVIERFSIPKFTTLLLADVDAGSHTPSMVGQVFKWKNSESESANQIWKELSIQNNQLKVAFERLDRLSSLNEQNYLSEVLKLSSDSNFHLQNDHSPVTETDDARTLFIKVSSITKSIRQLMKKMGTQSNVPIEPDSQTQLLDECEKRHGVIGSGVPGAGGYDAIWVLIFTPPSLPECATAENVDRRSGNIQHVIEFLNHWSHSSVKVLSSDSWVVGGSTNELRESSDNGHEDDGIKIFDDLQLVDCLKYQLDLFA